METLRWGLVGWLWLMGMVPSRGVGPQNMALHLYFCSAGEWLWYQAYPLPWCVAWPQTWDHQDQLTDHGQEPLKHQITALWSSMVYVMFCSAGELTGLRRVNPGMSRAHRYLRPHGCLSVIITLNRCLSWAVRSSTEAAPGSEGTGPASLCPSPWEGLWHLNCTNSDSYELYL